MSYSRKPTTPVSAQEAEGMLVIGYWIDSRLTTIPHICERHMNLLVRLDDQEEQRIEAEKVAQETLQETTQKAAKGVGELPEHYQQQIAEFQRRRQLVTTPSGVQQHPNVAPPIQQVIKKTVPFGMVAPVPSAPITTDKFVLGPGPLTNENNVTPHPALLIPNNTPQPLHAQPGTIEGALEAARMPPVEGGIVIHDCPMCGEQVTTGQVHAC